MIALKVNPARNGHCAGCCITAVQALDPRTDVSTQARHLERT